MSRVRVIKKDTDTKQLSEMFGQLIDPSSADPDIIRPKMLSLNTKLSQVVNLIRAFLNSKVRAIFTDLYFDDMAKYANDLEACVTSYRTCPDDILVKKYLEYKESPEVMTCVSICADLSAYKVWLDKSPKDKTDQEIHGCFLKDVRISTRVISVFSLDMYSIWGSDSCNNEVRKYILMWFHLLYKTVRNVYEIVTSPDIDVAQFVEVVVNGISKLESHPELHRCKNAFRVLRESIGMFENNFSSYYKDFVKSKNPSIIIESFIIDVASQPDHVDNARLVRELRKIVNYTKKMSNQNPNSRNMPELKKLFEVLEKNMSMVDERERPQERPVPANIVSGPFRSATSNTEDVSCEKNNTNPNEDSDECDDCEDVVVEECDEE